MGLFNKLMGKSSDTGDLSPAVASQQAVTRALRTMARGAPAPVAKAGAEMATALNTVETAILGIDSVSDLIAEAESLVATARDTDNVSRRALIAHRYRDVLQSIGDTILHSAHNGMNLLDGNRPHYEIHLDTNQRAAVALHVANLTTGEAGLALSEPTDNLAGNTEIEMTLAELDAAHRKTERVADLFADSAAVLAERLSRLDQEFGPDASVPHTPSGAVEPS